MEKTETNGNNSGQNFNNLTVRVCEKRKVRGIFYEHLELYEFPMDVQEVSITLASKLKIDEVELVENKREACFISTEDFLDCQEWNIYEHVSVTTTSVFDPWKKFDRSGLKVYSTHVC